MLGVGRGAPRQAKGRGQAGPEEAARARPAPSRPGATLARGGLLSSPRAGPGCADTRGDSGAGSRGPHPGPARVSGLQTGSAAAGPGRGRVSRGPTPTGLKAAGASQDARVNLPQRGGRPSHAGASWLSCDLPRSLYWGPEPGISDAAASGDGSLKR